jgi:predicted MFS family arabinose efflux permease
VASETRRSLATLLALNRTVVVVLLAVLFFGLGEQLWEPFLGVYLDTIRELKKEALAIGAVSAATLWTIAAYACLRQLFEAFCYISGGQLTAKLGDRGSLLLFGLISLVGYVLFLIAPMPALAIAAALFILGWEPLSVPVTFTTVGSTVKQSSQGMAFALQSIQKRLPKIIGPAIAGFVLGWAQRTWETREAGRVAGMQILVVVALVLGVVSLVIQFIYMPARKTLSSSQSAVTIVRSFHPAVKSLLLAEVFTRWCDQLVREFVVIYLVVVRRVPVEYVGLLIALQHTTALLTYLPVGQLTRSAGLAPFVGLTFIFFALFPLVLVLVPDGGWLVVAFIVYGLREIGEPARKAMITSLMAEEVRARGVGLYWGLRSIATAPAAVVTVPLWMGYGPTTTFVIAFLLGCVGAGVFYLLARRWASTPVRA